MKKMTQKEFFEILKESGHYATSYDDVLNAIAAGVRFNANDAKERGFNAAAAMYDKVWENLYKVLDERGYYKE